MAMRDWQAAIRRIGVAMVLLVALAGVQPDGSGTTLAYASSIDHGIERQFSATGPLTDAVSMSVTPQGSRVGVSINDDAISTPSLDVTLTMLPLSGAVQVRVSNSSDLMGSTWEPVALWKAWRLTPSATVGAPSTVYVQFGNGTGGVSMVYHDDIVVEQKRAAQAPAVSLTPGVMPGIGPGVAASVAPSTVAPAVAATATLAATSASGGGTVAAVSCSPRPRIDVRAERAVTISAIGLPGSGRAMNVTITVTGSGNTLRSVRFDAFANALVSVEGPEATSAPFTYTMPAGQAPTSFQFALWNQTRGQASTVRLTIVDSCGEWSTFVGGGVGMF
jgi:hypothetical protein